MKAARQRQTKRPAVAATSGQLPLDARPPQPAQPGPRVREPGPILAPLPAAASSLGEPLSIRQVALMLGCSPWTVRQTLIPKGLPYLRFTASGKLIFFADQVLRWIKDQQTQGGARP